MLLIYAPYPAPELVTNGWMRRIAAIERLFAERPRTYVWPVGPAWLPDPHDYRVRIERVAPGADFLLLDLRFSNHARKLAELVHEAELVYAHTSHSARHMLPFYGTGKIVTDLHGLAPEEEHMQGHPNRAAFFGAFEEAMVRRSARLVAVSEAMLEHFRAKYPDLATPHVLLPIVEELELAPRRARAAGEPPRVVYSGATQAWQRVDLMLDAVERARASCRYAFYTGDVANLRAAAAARGLAERIEIAELSPAELEAAYARADYGFVLREDNAVNRVSCPTKLSEYLATGVVPIVELVEIGDFARLGYRYVRFADFLAGRLPGADELAAMRAANRAVFERLRGAFERGANELRALRFGPPAARNGEAPLDLSSVERAAVFPLEGPRLVLRRGGASHALALDDVASPRFEAEWELPGEGPVEAVELRAGSLPLVLAPARIELVDARGRALPVELAGARRDRFGNWVFESETGACSAVLHVPDAERLRVRGEILLAGPEVGAILGSQRSKRPLWRRLGGRAKRLGRAAYRRLRALS